MLPLLLPKFTFFFLKISNLVITGSAKTAKRRFIVHQKANLGSHIYCKAADARVGRGSGPTTTTSPPPGIVGGVGGWCLSPPPKKTREGL